MLSIRQAGLTDLPIILSWTLALHEKEDNGELKPNPNFKSNLEKWLEHEFNNSNSLMLIGEFDSNAAGFISATTVINDNGFLSDPIKGIIHLLWVDVPYRNKKIASDLVSQIEECLKSVGVSYIECHYTSHNQDANHFWSSLGYQPNSITARKILKD